MDHNGISVHFTICFLRRGSGGGSPSIQALQLIWSPFDAADTLCQTPTTYNGALKHSVLLVSACTLPVLGIFPLHKEVRHVSLSCSS